MVQRTSSKVMDLIIYFLLSFSLCRSFDGQMRALLEDAGYYVKPPAKDKEKGQTDMGAFDQYADTPVILAFLQDSCETCCKK